MAIALTVDQFKQLLITNTGSTKMSVRYRSPAKTGKNSEYAGRLEKIKKVTGHLNFGERNGGPRPWGTRINGTALIEHKQQFYMEYRTEHECEECLCLDGVPITDEAELETCQAHVKTHAGGQGGTRTVKIERILSLRAFGEEYTIVK